MCVCMNAWVFFILVWMAFMVFQSLLNINSYFIFWDSPADAQIGTSTRSEVLTHSLWLSFGFFLWKVRSESDYWPCDLWPLTSLYLLFTGVKKRGDTLRSAVEASREMSIKFTGGANCELIIIIIIIINVQDMAYTKWRCWILPYIVWNWNEYAE